MFKKNKEQRDMRKFVSPDGTTIEVDVPFITYDADVKVYRLCDNDHEIIGWVPSTWICIATPEKTKHRISR